MIFGRVWKIRNEKGRRTATKLKDLHMLGILQMIWTPIEWTTFTPDN